MSKETAVTLAIIGAGTAGITAFKEASKFTRQLLLIDHGPLGTTCARVGCMPSKALLQIADYVHDCIYFSPLGIRGARHVRVDLPAAMKQVRALRDSFTSSTVNDLARLGPQLIQGTAEFITPNRLKVGRKLIVAKSIIIATGTLPLIPAEWRGFSQRILTSDTLFEQRDLPQKIAVIGGGAVGLELGQALSRLGITIALFHSHGFIGGLSDPIVNDYALKTLRDEFPIHLGQRASIEKTRKNLLVHNGKDRFSAEKILAALGRVPQLTGLNLEEVGIRPTALRAVSEKNMKIPGTSIYLAGDARNVTPILHEAADDGRIAGFNAVHKPAQNVPRRVPLKILFTQPNIAIIGKSFKELKNTACLIGEVRFDNQGRARIMSKNKGILRLYADRNTGIVLGAELFAPEGEHLAHLLAWVMQKKMTVFEILELPFYHPVIEEGLRTALQTLARKIRAKNTTGLPSMTS